MEASHVERGSRPYNVWSWSHAKKEMHLQKFHPEMLQASSVPSCDRGEKHRAQPRQKRGNVQHTWGG